MVQVEWHVVGGDYEFRGGHMRRIDETRCVMVVDKITYREKGMRPRRNRGASFELQEPKNRDAPTLRTGHRSRPRRRRP